MIDLPAIHVGALDVTLCGKLFDDIAAHGHVHQIRLKEKSQSYVERESAPSLESALTLLREGTVRAVQITYSHEGQTWRDTVLAHEGQFRLVRMLAMAE